MRGKVLNAVAALMNFLFGLVVLSYNFIAVNETRATANELIVMNQINTIILAVMIVVSVTNFILLIANRHSHVFLFAYIIAILADAFYIFDFNIIAILYLLSAFLICIQVLRENIIERNNTIFMIFISVIIAAIVLLGGYSLTYKDAVKDLDKKDAIGQIVYSEETFKNISELGISDLYINVKKDDKWGYINQKGEKVIDFTYDYASPFVKIHKFDKEFEVALVCKEGKACVILQNERVIFSYKNEISEENLTAQLEKFEQVYIETLQQEEPFENNIITCKTDDIRKIAAYSNEPYRYPINDDYDIYITVSSQVGRKNKYELIKRSGNSNVKISIDCDNLDFDSDYLYIFKNGYLPFYKTSEKMQGYYDNNMKRIDMGGNAQILEFYDDNVILLKDYNENLIYFMDSSGNILSDKYKDIYVYNDGYIVKKTNDKYTLIDKKYKKKIDKEFDYINPCLIDEGILICADIPGEVEFNEYDIPSNIVYSIMNLKGDIVSDGYTGIYNITNKNEGYEIEDYISELTDIEYSFVGEEFYSEEY